MAFSWNESFLKGLVKSEEDVSNICRSLGRRNEKLARGEELSV